MLFHNSPKNPIISQILFPYDVTLKDSICAWRHGGYVSGEERKHFSPLGILYLHVLKVHVNSSRKNSFVLTPNMAALLRGANQELVRSHGTITRDTFTKGNAFYRGACHCSPTLIHADKIMLIPRCLECLKKDIENLNFVKYLRITQRQRPKNHRRP